MQDAYVQAFVRLASSAREETGIELPLHIEHYVVCLLAVHVDNTHFLPKQSFAHSLMRVHNSRTAKELGDTCLFVTSVFPEYGVNERYYTDIGVTAYNSINTELFQTISVHFETVKTFTRYACRGASAVSTSLL
jgi:hypothetical protein